MDASWQLAKESKKAELSNVLRTLVESVRQISLLAAPFIPDAARKIWQAYGFAGHFEDLTFAALADDAILEKGLLLKDAKLNLFPRIEALKEDPVVPQVEPAKAEVAKTSEEGLIDIKDFARIDLRVAKVLAAEKVEKADKLLKLQVELGSETRQVIAGIAAFYQPEQLLGKSVVMVANLKPAKIRGIESYGMLLAAKEGDKLLLLTPDGPISSGVKVG